MLRVSIDNIRPGMRLSKPIFAPNGNVLLHEGIEIKDRYIRYLQSMGISSVYVDDEQTADIVVEDVVSPSLRQEATKTAHDIVSEFKVGKGVDMSKVQEMVTKMIEQLADNKDRLVNFIDIRQKSDYLFSHSVNTCILSIMTGLSLNYSPDKLRELGLAAMFHDIGKLLLSDHLTQENLLYLTQKDQSEYRRHPFYSGELLRRAPGISQAVIDCAVQHHERWDGSGYPNGLMFTQISEFAQIVSIADAYDKLTSGTPHRRPTPVYYVFSILKKAAGQYFHPGLIDKFTENIAIFPVGTAVRLNNNKIGIIVDVNKNNKSLPIVRLLNDEYQTNTNSLVELDLSKNPGIFIVDFAEM